jgi:hypothetical protein
MLLPWSQSYICISANRYGAAQYPRYLSERMKLIFYSQTLLIMLQIQHVFPQPTFRTRPPQLNYLPRPPTLPSFCGPLIRYLPYIARPTIRDITLSRNTSVQPLCNPDYAHDPWKRWKRYIKSQIVGPYIPYGLFHTKGEMCAMFGSDWFRNVDLYKAQINTHTNIHLYI